MKRLIKFRGRDRLGEYYFGSFDEDSRSIDTWDVAGIVVVDRDSVAQLVGFDRDGKEVYEGDKVISPDGYEYTAELCCYPKLDSFKLKEVTL